MRPFNSNAGRMAAMILGLLIFGLLAGAGVQYYRWREGLLAQPYHADVPLGKFSLGRLHFGACVADVTGGGFATYCDGGPIPPPGSALPGTPSTSQFWLGPKDGNAVTLCLNVGGADTVVIVPLP
jgi:hypothetical protein